MASGHRVPGGHGLPTGDAIGHLAAAMAHEVRNRLNPINIRVELLRARADASHGDLAKALAVIQSEVDRIDEILGEYLRHAGPVEAALVRKPVARLIGDVVERASDAATARGVRLEVSAARTEAWPMDAAALGLALDALVANAIEASPTGGTVSIAARQSEETGTIEIVDRGEGIAKELLNKVFALGYSTRSGRAGTGLAVAKQAVRAHPGGSLILRSEGLQKGVSVRIEIPLDSDDGDGE